LLSFSYPVSSAVAKPGAPNALNGLSAARAWRLYFKNSSVLFLVVPREGPLLLVEAIPPLAVVTSMLLGSKLNLLREDAIAGFGASSYVDSVFFAQRKSHLLLR
jgi:hypothetical protein